MSGDAVGVVAGQTIANTVVTSVGTNGRICVFTSAATHLLADLSGYFPAGSLYVGVQPARLMDSRAGEPTIDGQLAGAGLVAAGSTTRVRVAGRGGIPGALSTAVMHLTVTQPRAGGFVTVLPCGSARPVASNVNFAAGDTVANAVVGRVGDGGDVCVFTSAATHLIVDVTGSFP